MALAMPIAKRRHNETYKLSPLVKTQISGVECEDASPLDIASLVRRMVISARPVCSHSRKYSPEPSREFTFGTWSDDKDSVVDDPNKYIIRLITFASNYQEPGQTTIPLDQQRETVAPTATATFIRPIEYAWTEDFFAAEEALKAYLNKSNADH